jgi:hypothetical protein
MTKYLLDYSGGCKGDFLCNFLNHGLLFLEDNLRSKSVDGGLKRNYSQERIEHFLLKDICILPMHNQNNFFTNIIKKYPVKVFKLKIEPKFYKTAMIEFIIKNNTAKITKEVLFSNQSYDVLKNFKQLKYHIDLLLKEKDNELTDKIRYEKIISLLNEVENNYEIYEISNNAVDNIYKELYYGNLYVNKKYDMLYEIKPDFNSIHYENLLEKTWLPDVLNVFGYDINLRKYGYRDY